MSIYSKMLCNKLCIVSRFILSRNSQACNFWVVKTTTIFICALDTGFFCGCKMFNQSLFLGEFNGEGG